MQKSDKNISRRSFLTRLGVAGAGVAAAPLLMGASEASASRATPTAPRTTSTKLLMGTFVTMVVTGRSQPRAQEAIEAAYNEIERLSAIFNRYQGSTALEQLNSQGVLKNAPVELVEVMSLAGQYYNVSDKLFDATVAPVVDLYRISREQNTSVDSKDLQAALDLVNGSGIKVSGSTISLGSSEMAVTLDGIAKGYIVDQASRVLSSKGCSNHLINAGGDIRVSGTQDANTPWKVAIEDPAKRGDYPDMFAMTNGAVATSGGYEVYFDRAGHDHHIISPANGVSPNQAVSVSVKAPSAMEADVLATAVMTMGVKQSMEFINALPGRECLIVLGNGAQARSVHWG